MTINTVEFAVTSCSRFFAQCEEYTTAVIGWCMRYHWSISQQTTAELTTKSAREMLYL